MRDEKNVLLIDSLNNTTYLFQVKYQYYYHYVEEDVETSI